MQPIVFDEVAPGFVCDFYGSCIVFTNSIMFELEDVQKKASYLDDLQRWSVVLLDLCPSEFIDVGDDLNHLLSHNNLLFTSLFLGLVLDLNPFLSLIGDSQVIVLK
jgi:hypothetical protein